MSDVSRGRRLLEVAAVLAIAGGYVAFQRQVADRWYFVLPALLVLAGYVVASWMRAERLPSDFGLGRAGLWPAAKWAALITTATAIPCVVIGICHGIAPTPAFWMMLVGYPIWAVAQQFVFQGVLHENLIRLGAGWWSVLLVAVVFAAVHLPSTRLIYLSAASGLVFSVIYRCHRNLLPLGLAHGVCGACLYHFVFTSDLVGRFLEVSPR